MSKQLLRSTTSMTNNTPLFSKIGITYMQNS